MSSHDGVLTGSGTAQFEGNFLAGGIFHQVMGIFTTAGVPGFIVPQAKFDNMPGGTAHTFHGHIGPTDIYIQITNRPNSTISGILAQPIASKIPLTGTLTVT